MAENEYGQPLGAELGGWLPPDSAPDHDALQGRTVLLEPLDPHTHAGGLFEVLGSAPRALWTYMGFGPFDSLEELRAALNPMVDADDWRAYAFVVDGRPAGFASYLRISPRDAVIEIGSIVFAPDLQRTTPATEGIFLMIDHAFATGYRRVEWKCDDLNAASIRAAQRLGFVYEGTFRKATHYKGRNRDTAWFAIVDTDWPRLRSAFMDWLSPDNFNEDGQQRERLEDLR